MCCMGNINYRINLIADSSMSMADDRITNVVSCIKCLEEKTNFALKSIDEIFSKSVANLSHSYDSASNSFIKNLDSTLIDTLAKSHWYSFYDNAFDKMLSSYTALFVALLTTAVAVYLLKYWYDNKVFKENFSTAQNKISDISQKWKDSSKEVAEQIKEIKQQMESLKSMKGDFEKNIEKMQQEKEELEKNIEKMQHEKEELEQSTLYKFNDFSSEIFLLKKELKIYVDFSQWKNEGHGPESCKNFLDKISSLINDARQKDSEVSFVKSPDAYVKNQNLKNAFLWLDKSSLLNDFFSEVNKLDIKYCGVLFDEAQRLKIDLASIDLPFSFSELDKFFKKFSEQGT